LATSDLPSNAPVSDEDSRIMESGVFDSEIKPDYQRMMTLRKENELIRGTSDAERIRRLQNYNDVVNLRFHCLKARHDTATAIKLLVRTQDCQMFAREMVRAGYAASKEEILDPVNGKLVQAAETRANEMQWPGNTTAGLDNLSFELLSSQLLDKVDLGLRVAANVRQIPLTRSQQKFPKLLSDSMAVRGTGGDEAPRENDPVTTEPALPDPTRFTRPGFGSVSFDCEHLMSYLIFNDDQLEDSIIPWLPLMREQAALAIARGLDHCIFNGDDTTTGAQDHMDGISPSPDDPYDIRRCWDGLRYICYGHRIHESPDTLAACSVILASASPTGTNLQALDIHNGKKIMGKYALNPSDVVYMGTVGMHYDLMKDADVKTVDKFGDLATIRRGVLAQVYGVDLMWTEFAPTTAVSTTGVGTGGATGVGVMWNKDRFMLGRFDRVVIEATRWAPKLYTIIQADVRMDFQPIETPPFNTAAGPWPAVAFVGFDP
jgi:hypothetical protein